MSFPLRPVRAFLVVAAAALAAQPASAADPAPTKVRTVEGITEYKLPNGLQILLIPDPSQPKVTVNATVFCGSRHEGYGETGMAHLLEHMVFKGSPKFPDVPKALRDHGAEFNGTTWVDRTNYFETMPATDENLEFGIELEADRLSKSFIKRDDLLSEFTVVRNEFEAGENSPTSVLFQRMLATAYEWHNYGKSTIGNRTDIERVPVDNLQAFYKKYYRPDNMMLVVAGKFDEAKALELVARHWGPLKNPDDPLPKTYTEEPAQDGERLVTLRRVGTVAAVGAVYHIPASAHPDYPACAVLNSVLTSEPAGRLYKALVEGKKASSIFSLFFQTHDPGAFIFVAQTDPDKAEAARETLVKTLETLGENPITEDEVRRAIREFQAGRERLFANSQGLAVDLSEWAACGDWRLFFLHRDRLEKVTAADVNRVAGQYLVRSNRTVGVYTPTKEPQRAAVPVAQAAAEQVKDYKGRDAVAGGEAFDPTPENVEKRVVRGAVGDGVKSALLNKKTRGGTVNLLLNLRFGNEKDLAGKTTAAEYVGSMLLRGTATRTRQQIKDEFDKLGSRVYVSSTGRGGLYVNVQAKRDTLPAVLDVLADCLRHPSFPPAEFDILKRERVDQYKEGKTEPQVLAFTALNRKLNPYPPEDVRYVPTVDESIAREEAVALDQVKAVYADMLGGGAGEFVVVGEFDPDGTKAKVDGMLKGWAAKVPYRRISGTAQPTAGGTERIDTPDKENAVYAAGANMRLKDSDPDYAPLALGNFVLGEAPLSSRISNRVRGKDGLSYGAGSNVQADPLDPDGGIMVFAITNPKNLGKVDAAIAEEVGKFVAEGPSASELDEAKKGYVQARQVRRSDDGDLAQQLATALRAGRTMAFEAEFEKKVGELQPGDVKAAFGKHLDPKKLAVIQAGDFTKAKDEGKKK
ncbi:MAG: insulinase family protein [Gemmataceae bacterium]|nr:insulinase family protein [Gemmataceae bacterium]